MAYGGGSFTSQNKVLPGVYVNVTAGSKATSEIAERGVAAIGMDMTWGKNGELIYLTESDFRQNALAKLGYSYNSDELKGLRDLFKNASACYIWRLSTGEKAENELAVARYGGTRGNDLCIEVSKGNDSYTVVTLLGGVMVDSQQVESGSELQDNDYVCWRAEVELSEAGSFVLSGGTDVSGTADYTAMFAALEGVQFNVLAALATDEASKQLFLQYTKEQRENCGKKFQTVLYQYAADYEGVISLQNDAKEEGMPVSAGVYWLAGAEAGCAVNESLTNKLYDGEIAMQAVVGQAALQEALNGGNVVLHKLNDKLRILEDINTMQDMTQGEDMRQNQTVRVLDQIVNDLSNLFYEKYLGQVLNDSAGRVSLWNDIVSYYRKLEKLRAIEGFDTADITVEQGENKKSVLVTSYLTVINAMSQLYLTVTFE